MKLKKVFSSIQSSAKTSSAKTQGSQISSEDLPTYEESAQSEGIKPAVNYFEEFQNAQKPTDLLRPLLSDELSIDEKHKLMQKIPAVVFKNNGGDIEDLEARLTTSQECLLRSTRRLKAAAVMRKCTRRLPQQ